MKRLCFTVMLGGAVTACSGSPSEGELGTAADPLVGVYCITGVRASLETVHFAGLRWLINSAEATGPISLTANVGVFVAPVMSTTVVGVDPNAVSRTVGYSLLQRRDIIAISAATLADWDTSRLEAYTAFEETAWEVRDPACNAVLGTGASFDPSGVFFQTVPANHVPLPDMSLVGFVPGCVDLACGPLPGAGGAPDAGAPGTAGGAWAPGFVPSALNPLATGGGGRR